MYRAGILQNFSNKNVAKNDENPRKSTGIILFQPFLCEPLRNTVITPTLGEFLTVHTDKEVKCRLLTPLSLRNVSGKLSWTSASSAGWNTYLFYAVILNTSLLVTNQISVPVCSINMSQENHFSSRFIPHFSMIFFSISISTVLNKHT